MTTLISFPVEDRAEVRTFSTIKAAERAAEKVPNGPRFVLSEVTETTLKALTLPLLTVIYNTANPEQDDVKRLGSKKDAVERVLPLIESLAQPGEEQSTPTEEAPVADTEEQEQEKPQAKARGKSKAKKSGKKAAAKKDSENGRVSPLAGKKLVKTAVGNDARRRSGTRRTESWNAFQSGWKYETAVEKGAHPDDITIMVRLGHVVAED